MSATVVTLALSPTAAASASAGKWLRSRSAPPKGYAAHCAAHCSEHTHSTLHTAPQSAAHCTVSASTRNTLHWKLQGVAPCHMATPFTSVLSSRMHQTFKCLFQASDFRIRETKFWGKDNLKIISTLFTVKLTIKLKMLFMVTFFI